MVEDIRSYLELVKTTVPDEYVEIEKEVDPLYEATAIVKKLEDQGKYPLVLFKNMRNLKGVPGHKHLINLLASRRRLALAFGLRPDQWKVELMQEVLRKSRMRLKTVTVAPGEAPVKEVVRVGEKADLSDLPMLKEHEMDGSHYTTMPVVVYKGAEAGYNSAHARMMYAGKREGRFLFAPTHTWTVLRENELKKSNTRAAVVLGHHPAYCIASASRGTPFSVSEYEVAGGMLGGPLRVVPSETWGKEFLVPADAEIIVEGEFLANVRRAEGPFGEWHSYYGPQHSQGMVLDIKAITMRKDPIMITQFGGHRDHYNYRVGYEAQVYRRVGEAVPTVRAVVVPSSSRGQHLHISIKKMTDGDPKMAGLAALSVGWPKLVVVVDEDVDPFNEEEVLWAVATRMQADERVMIIKGMKGSVVDPSLTHPYLHTAMLIDATKPAHKSFPEKVNIPEDVMKRMRLEDYIRPSELDRLA